jgi:FAD/FMN-containing dehydrogenase
VLASSLTQAKAIWAVWHSVSEDNKRSGYVVSHDSVVPRERQAAFVSNVETRIMAGLPHARVVMHGHIGDGNIHVVALDIDLMRGIKQLLDPNGLMNSDKIFAAERHMIGSAGAV